MINFIVHMFLIAIGCAIALLGIDFYMQFRKRIATEKLVPKTFWRFHVYFGGVLGIIDIVMGVVLLVLAALTGIFKPF